ncbi:hypothetical protein DPMN_078832 [Dreissena polymorpha]|uniref:Uncharacterized protein n=1 Tax=Dreissena polymorpha TaxID=45954 RepID=A0A9D4BQT3_DREPO|nr:hypothetical protein DPMN_078832 [Dreissena polymorpha]
MPSLSDVQATSLPKPPSTHHLWVFQAAYNLETDHYNSINDTEEPYQSVKDDYDYTSNAVRTEPNTRKPDAIYNKLKLDRPGDYDHVAGLGYNMSQPGSDYDTSALARTNAGGDDYNHITTAFVTKSFTRIAKSFPRPTESLTKSRCNELNQLTIYMNP